MASNGSRYYVGGLLLLRPFKFRPSWLDADLVSQSTSAGDASRDQDRAAARGSNLVANDIFAQPRPEAALAIAMQQTDAVRAENW
jgi:hypothetical protein